MTAIVNLVTQIANNAIGTVQANAPNAVQDKFLTALLVLVNANLAISAAKLVLKRITELRVSLAKQAILNTPTPILETPNSIVSRTAASMIRNTMMGIHARVVTVHALSASSQEAQSALLVIMDITNLVKRLALHAIMPAKLAQVQGIRIVLLAHLGTIHKLLQHVLHATYLARPAQAH